MTAKEFAEIIGVSRVTLSKVLNNKGGVAPETVEKIRRYIEEYHFEPNSQARSLVGKKDKIIGLFSAFKSEFGDGAHIPTDFPSQMISLITSEAQEHGYKSLVSIVRSSDDLVSVEKLLNSDVVRGAILMGFETGDYVTKNWSRSGYPMVLINQEDSITSNNVSLVNQSDEAGAYRAIELLAENGHKRICFLGSSLNRLTAHRRQRGALRALEQYKDVFEKVWHVDADYEEEQAYNTVLRIYTEETQYPTAIFATNDVMALGAMRALEELGYQIPEQVSVIGFDNIPLSGYMRPSLTTFDANFVEIAKKSVKILIDNIEGRNSACHEELEARFVERETLKEINMDV